MAEYPKNLIFLDIDGCLTSVDDKSYYYGYVPGNYHVSEQIVNNVIEFCKKNDSRIILASNWRYFDDDFTWTNKHGTFKNPMSYLKELLGDLVVGELPKEHGLRKSEALILWFIDNPDFKGNFVIFDDDPIEMYQSTCSYGIKDHFVFVIYEHGITDDDLKEASELLSRK